MNRAEILAELVRNKEYRRACDRISRNSQLAADLFSEMCEVVCLLDEQKLIGLYERDELRWFIVKVLTTMWQCKSSPFFKTYRMPFIASQDFHDVGAEYDQEADTLEQRRIDAVQRVFDRNLNSEDRNAWYDAKLTLIYIEAGSLRKASEKLNIAHTSIGNSVRRMRLMVEKEIELTEPKQKK